MEVKKVAAGAILTLVLPVLADIATEPFSDRGMIQTWFYGAGKLGFLGVLGWSFDQFRDDERANQASVTGR